MKAALIIIGNEILSGRTVDKNTSFIAKWLGDLGISVEEVAKVTTANFFKLFKHTKQLGAVCS